MSEQTMKAIQTEYGFQWGEAIVTRLFSDDQKGYVTIGVESSKEKLQIYVTRGGKIRVHQTDGVEWKPEKAKRGKR